LQQNAQAACGVDRAAECEARNGVAVAPAHGLYLERVDY
jgi:hypothetical protein